MKRIITLMLSTLILLGSMAGCSKEKTPPAEEQTADWKNLYVEYIQSAEVSEYESANYIGVNDLNFDGVPELIFSNQAASAACYVKILHIKDGKVEPLDVGVALYSIFTYDWISLRKNKNTGEMKYVFRSGNGSDMESFGNIISFGSASKEGEFNITNEFEHEELRDITSEGDYYVAESNFYVAEKKVSENEYDKAYDEFFKTWEDTDFKNYAMLDVYSEYPKKLPVSIETDDLMELFDKYQAEK